MISYPDDSVAIGVDIGGTKIRFGLVRSDGLIFHTLILPTKAAEQRVMEQVYAGIEQILSVWENSFASHRLNGIGIGSAGQIDFLRGTVHFASELIPGYTGTPVRELVTQRFDLPVYIDNDVNVLALAESRFGAGMDCRNMVCLALGTGVGGAVIADGRLLHGANGGAGEIGHMTVNMNGPACICGSYGCLEIYASGTGIFNRYQELTALNFTKQANSAKDVVERWLSGEMAARQVIEMTIAGLGAAIASLIHIFNPEVIVIGGGIAELGEPLFAPLRSRISTLAMPSMLEAVRIVPAELGGSSNMVGAAIQVWEYGI